MSELMFVEVYLKGDLSVMWCRRATQRKHGPSNLLPIRCADLLVQGELPFQLFPRLSPHHAQDPLPLGSLELQLKMGWTLRLPAGI